VRPSIHDIFSRTQDGNARRKLRSFAIVVGLFVVLLVIALTTSWTAIALINDTRAYAVGEGRYSKAQKMAVLDLYRYAHSRAQGDYDSFLNDIQIPLGDHQARMALSRSPVNIAAATRGFLRGQNHPRDIGGLIQMYEMFYWWKPFAAAVEDWHIADGQVEDLIAQGTRLHALVTEGRLDPLARSVALARIASLDTSITARENTFSTHMGEAARFATTLVDWGLGFSTVLLWAIGIGFAVRLIRQQLALDRQLSSSERRFRDYAEVASDWYWEMDADNRITYISERYALIVNMRVEDAIGQSGVEFIRQSAEYPVQRDECLLAIAERRPFRGLCLHAPKPDGTNNYFAISGKPNINSAGEFQGFRGIGTDITSQVNDAHVLRDARDRAEVANRAKSEFLANMSHELRTPLNAILGFSDVIGRRMYGPDAMDRYADYARDIHNSGAHLLAIINDILDLSKIEAGQGSLEESEVGLDTVMEEVRTLLGDQAKHGRAPFRVNLPAPPPRVRVDERKIVQILVNLLSNAFKFTPQAGSVTLSAAVSPDGGLCITVRDTGIGIAPDHLETVLKPFGQVESAFSRRHHGTGLGLPLAKSLVELHGGSLSVDSALGKGTTVTVTLPAARVVPLLTQIAHSHS
jgi:PAS domain S-box-containing protein